ncbi:hypothetical protein FA10DRAFT_223224, partial [Acaromyces ingoldii]
PPNSGIRARLRFLMRRYGWWALAVYMLASVFDFSLAFASIHLLGADHIRELEEKVREKVGMGKREMEDEEAAKMGAGSGTLWTEAVLAYTIHKTLLMPLRLGITAAFTPRFVKWMVKMGWA